MNHFVLTHWSFCLQHLLPRFFQQLLHQHHVGMVLLLAFFGGVISSLLPCTVGMLPILVGYVGGYSENHKWGVLRQVLLFIFGFSLVMMSLGILASVLGVAMASLVGAFWYYGLGGLAILMGLQLLEWIHLPLPQWITRLPKPDTQTTWGRFLSPILLGAAFGAASSPCGTPFLTVILGFMSREKNWLLGGSALLVYAWGQSILLLVVGLCTGLVKQMGAFRRVGSVLTVLSGLVFILAGILLIAKAAGWLDVL